MYSQGKIYKLYSTEGDECYIGSTIQPLWRRLQVHKYPTNNCRSRELFEKYNCVEIELLEEYPCNCRYELEQRETEYIFKTDNCINKYIPNKCIREKENYVNNSEEVKNFKFRGQGDAKKLAELKREKRREFDLQRYNKNPEQARKTKILQKLSNVGNVPTEASIDKYNITINDLLKLQEYLGKIDNLENKEKINNKLLNRIKYINNKN
jgi:hypothetical protein